MDLGNCQVLLLIDDLDVLDDINEENVLCEFIKFTKTKKLQKKTKEQISDHPDGLALNFRAFITENQSFDVFGLKTEL